MSESESSIELINYSSSSETENYYISFQFQKACWYESFKVIKNKDDELWIEKKKMEPLYFEVRYYDGDVLLKDYNGRVKQKYHVDSDFDYFGTVAFTDVPSVLAFESLDDVPSDMRLEIRLLNEDGEISMCHFGIDELLSEIGEDDYYFNRKLNLPLSYTRDSIYYSKYHTKFSNPIVGHATGYLRIGSKLPNDYVIEELNPFADFEFAKAIIAMYSLRKRKDLICDFKVSPEDIFISSEDTSLEDIDFFTDSTETVIQKGPEITYQNTEYDINESMMKFDNLLINLDSRSSYIRIKIINECLSYMPAHQFLDILKFGIQEGGRYRFEILLNACKISENNERVDDDWKDITEKIYELFFELSHKYKQRDVVSETEDEENDFNNLHSDIVNFSMNAKLGILQNDSIWKEVTRRYNKSTKYNSGMLPPRIRFIMHGIFYLLWLILLTIVLAENIDTNLSQIQANSVLNTNLAHKFSSVTTATGIYSWINNSLPFLFKSDGYNSGYLVAEPILRQFRVKGAPCKTLKEITCYGSLADSTYEYKEKMWKSTEMQSIGAFPYLKSRLDNPSFSRGHYDRSGYAVKMNASVDTISSTIWQLENETWIDEGTRAVIFEILVYFPSDEIITVVPFILEQSPMGELYTSYDYFSMSVTQLFNDISFKLILFIIIHLDFMCQELIQILINPKNYLSNWENMLDLAIFWVFGLAFVINKILVVYQYEIDVDTFEGIEGADVVGFIYHYEITNLIGTIAAGMAYIRVFYFLIIFEKVGNLVTSLRRMTKSVFLFLILLGIMLVIYSTSMSVLLGPIDPLYASTFSSFYQLLLSAFGNYSFHHMRGIDAQVLPSDVVGDILELTYVFISIILMVNLFIAMMGTAYSGIQERSLIAWRIELSELILELETWSLYPTPFNLPALIFLYIPGMMIKSFTNRRPTNILYRKKMKTFDPSARELFKSREREDSDDHISLMNFFFTPVNNDTD